MARRILTGEQRHPARRANGARGVSAIEVRPFAGHPVEVWRIETGGAHATEVIGAMLIGGDEQDVWAHG